MNKLSHLTRLGRKQPPPHTIGYIKPDSAIVDPFGDIQYPAVTAQLDDEVELVAVIGRRWAIRRRPVPQRENTRDMIFPVDELLNFVDARIELRAGDLVFTGSPCGVGLKDGRFLRPGDRVEAEIEGIGKLNNRVGMPRRLSEPRSVGRLGMRVAISP